LPSVLDPAEGERAMGRSLELAALLKASNNGSATGAQSAEEATSP
jgi:hypothetical protein